MVTLSMFSVVEPMKESYSLLAEVVEALMDLQEMVDKRVEVQEV